MPERAGATLDVALELAAELRATGHAEDPEALAVAVDLLIETTGVPEAAARDQLKFAIDLDAALQWESEPELESAPGDAMAGEAAAPAAGRAGPDLATCYVCRRPTRWFRGMHPGSAWACPRCHPPTGPESSYRWCDSPPHEPDPIPKPAASTTPARARRSRR